MEPNNHFLADADGAAASFAGSPAEHQQQEWEGSHNDAVSMQPQVSDSSPSRQQRSRSKTAQHQQFTAASADDLSELVRELNALSARLGASEQQLARTRRELGKERQRSRQLRASYDALTLNALHSSSASLISNPGDGVAGQQQQQQQQQSQHLQQQTARRQRYSLAQAAGSAGQGASYCPQQRPAAWPASVAAPARPAAAEPVSTDIPPATRRWSRDTNDDDQGLRSRSSSRRASPEAHAASTEPAAADTNSTAAGAAAGAVSGSSVQQAGRVLSKRPAQANSRSITDEPLVKAARRWSTEGAGASHAPAQGAAPAGSNIDGDSLANHKQEPPSSASATAAPAAAQTAEVAGKPRHSSKERSQQGAHATEPLPAPAPGGTTVRSSAAGPCSMDSAGSAAYKQSRLSAVSDCSALAIVPVSVGSRSSGRYGAAHDSSSRAGGAPPRAATGYSSSSSHAAHRFAAAGAAAAAAAAAAAGRSSTNASANVNKTGGSSSSTNESSSSSSYGKRAAKAAKGLVSKLRKLFMGLGSSSSDSGGAGDGGSSSNTDGSASRGAAGRPHPAAAGNTGDGCAAGRSSSARSSGTRHSDFRRSWQGPFFSSSGAAARAAAAEQQAAGRSRDDSSSPHMDNDDDAPPQEDGVPKARRWRAPKWARRYASSDTSSDTSSEEDAGGVFDDDPFGPTFSPLRHNFCRQQQQQGGGGEGAAGGAPAGGDSPFLDPFGPAFSPLRQSMRFPQPSSQQQQQAGGCAQPGSSSSFAAAAAAGAQRVVIEPQGDDEGFGPGWLGID